MIGFLEPGMDMSKVISAMSFIGGVGERKAVGFV